MWSPKTKKDGARNPFYDNMLLVRPGDIIFSYSQTTIRAIGIAQSVAETSIKPSFNKVTIWDSVGWKVDVNFQEIPTPLRTKNHIDLLAPFAGVKYSPIQSNGDGKQAVYLAEIPKEFADILIDLSGVDLGAIQEEFVPLVDEELASEIDEVVKLKNLEGNTEAIEIVRSRRGQGIFRNNVHYYEKKCRLTGVRNISHLRASHIKPWSESTDGERLDGANGLLLSPHVDHLFDRGFISFTNSGKILVATNLEADVIRRWSLDVESGVGEFANAQAEFLEYHRDAVFEKSLKAVAS